MNQPAPAKKRPLVILAIFVLLLLVLCLWLYFRKPAEAGGETAPTLKAETILAFLPSADADETTVSMMKAAAAQILEDAQAAESQVSALAWRDGVPPRGPSFELSAVSTPAELESALSSARAGGNLTAAFRQAKTLSEQSASPYRKVVLLTDRAPMDGEEEEEGAYDNLDSAAYRYANAAAGAASELSLRDSLSVVAFLREISGREFDFARRFFNDIQTGGYYEILSADALGAFRKQVASELLAESGAQKLTFRYMRGRDYSAVCYYSDDYFSASPYEYNQSLATMSLSFAMSAFASGDQPRYADKSANARDLLKKIGAAESAIDTNEWFTLRPETDSIGVVSGSKPISVNGEPYTLIAVAMRGGGYGREWASNFTIGETGQHSGFDTAKNNVLGYLKDYIAKQKITGRVKFWVTGFSRAAATANLVAGELDKGYDFGADITYAPQDVYAYCFETPAGALVEETRNQEVYYNIFNIINQSDPVPFVAPSSLGFGRYGIDRYLPSAQSSSNYLAERAAMLRVYRALDSTGAYGVDNFRMQKLNLANLLAKDKSVAEEDAKNNYSQGVYLSNYVTTLAKEFIKDRENYVARYQDEIREICSIIYGCSDAQQEALINSLTEQAAANWPQVVAAYFNPLVPKEGAFSIVSDWLVNAVNAAGVDDYDEETLRSAGAALSDLLVNLLARYPNEATTLVKNLSGIGEAHSWELCFAWMASMDANYKRGAETAFNQGDYRIVRVNCDVDVSVRDDSGAVVAQIVNENPQDIRGSSIISAVNENGEKVVILPMDSAYRVSVTRREDSEPAAPSGGASESVNIGIDEYSAQSADVARGVDYLDIPLEPGETLEGALPVADAAQETAYALAAPDGSAIASASDLSGEAAETVYAVAAAPSDENAGMVLGGGAFHYGDFAQLEAAPHDGYAFAGWHDPADMETPVSTEAVFRFCVTQDAELVAVFTTVEPTAAPVKGGAFADVSPQSYCYDAVMWASETGVAGGTTETTFSPSEPCTAAQAVTFLWRAAGSPEPTATQSPFADLSPDAYYYKAVLWAAERDIAMGTAENTFSPEKTVSRSQFITLLYRTFGTERMDENPFADVPGDAYYRDAVAWAYAKGVTRGVTATTFQPLRACNRGQIVTFLHRYFVR
ncbi:MAG: S-layer homology domain-containing protein [Oscillibacter sp.]|nr:S-layer homology domain-containing protein [Oscillibacter sp.]